MPTILENQPESQTKLPIRWADADAKAIASLIAILSNILTARDRRMNLVADFLAAMRDHRWSSPKFQDIYNAIDRLARAGILPLAGPLEAELRRVSAVEAADFIAEHKHDFPGDAETEYWIDEAIRLGKLCALRSSLDNAGQRIDAGQEDVELILAEINAAGESGTAADAVIHADELIAENPPLAEVVIDGALRRGEVGLLIGAPKTCKTWAVLHLHCAMATGGSWLGHKCRKGRTLMIDGELSAPVIGHRLARVGALYGMTDYASIDILPLRGDPRDIDRLGPLLARIRPGQYDLVTVDPIFKLLPADADENSNAYIAGFFRKVIAFAERTQAAVVCIHHASKGVQGGKSVSDMGAGGGAQSRSVDWHAALREHSEPGCVSLHTICRSFPGTPPTVWRMEPPEIVPMPEHDPENLRAAKPRKSAEPKPDKPARANWNTVATLANGEPHELSWFAAKLNLGASKTRDLLGQATAVKAIYMWPIDRKRGLPARWAKEPETML